MDDTDRKSAVKAAYTPLGHHDPRARADVLFMENWERRRAPELAAVSRAGQIGPANPHLAATIARLVKETA